MSEATTARSGTPDAASHVAIEEPEPWEAWETKLVVWSVSIGVAGLIVFGILVNIYLLK